MCLYLGMCLSDDGRTNLGHQLESYPFFQDAHCSFFLFLRFLPFYLLLISSLCRLLVIVEHKRGVDALPITLMTLDGFNSSFFFF